MALIGLDVTTRARTAVVHLVREGNGFEPFAAFMASYERCHAGVEHELVLLFKGFGEPGESAPYLERAADCAPLKLDVSDAGPDLAAYVAAAGALDHQRLCFVNSFSEVLVPGWLGLLDEALSVGSTGAAGATGSWASHLSYGLLQLGWPGVYADAFGGWRGARRASRELPGTSAQRGLAAWLLTLQSTALAAPAISLFPNPHLRTNAFLIGRETLRALRAGSLSTKAAAHRLESGRAGITAQLRALGRPAAVVDRHGVARGEADWAAGNVFWQGDQEDLLVSDNQTRLYAEATLRQRDALARVAWGVDARAG